MRPITRELESTFAREARIVPHSQVNCWLPLNFTFRQVHFKNLDVVKVKRFFEQWTKTFVDTFFYCKPERDHHFSSRKKTGYYPNLRHGQDLFLDRYEGRTSGSKIFGIDSHSLAEVILRNYRITMIARVDTRMSNRADISLRPGRTSIFILGQRPLG